MPNPEPTKQHDLAAEAVGQRPGDKGANRKPEQGRAQDRS